MAMPINAIRRLRRSHQLVGEMLRRSSGAVATSREDPIAMVGVVRGGGSALKGTKVYENIVVRQAETSAGRGAKPGWLVATTTAQIL
jgi:hypothetical protein